MVVPFMPLPRPVMQHHSSLVHFVTEQQSVRLPPRTSLSYICLFEEEGPFQRVWNTHTQPRVSVSASVRAWVRVSLLSAQLAAAVDL